MNIEGTSSIEIESEPPIPIKLPDGQNIRKKNEDGLICGWQLGLDQPVKQEKNESWQLDLDQPVKQEDNELYQPISFKLNWGYPNLEAVSNNKLVAINWNSRITVYNLATKKKVNLKLYPYLNDIDIWIDRCIFYNNEDFIMCAKHSVIEEFCDYYLILKGSFKNSNEQSWTINNSISCGNVKDVKCYMTKEKIMLLDKSSTKPVISNKGFKQLIDEKIYYISEGVLPRKSQIEKILQELISENEGNDSIRMKETKSYEGSLVKWEVNGEENVIQAFKKTDSNTWEDVSVDNFDFLFDCKKYVKYVKENRRLLLLKEFLDNLLDNYIEDNILMKLYGQELIKLCLKFQYYLLAEKLCNKIYNEPNLSLMKLCGGEFLKGLLKLQFYLPAEILCNKICKEAEKDNFLEKIQLLNILTFSFKELTQYPQLLKKCLSYILFIHLNNHYEKVNLFFSKPHLQSHIKYLQPSVTSNIKKNIKSLFTLLKISKKETIFDQ
ncbi:1753_t:CDS:2, partial [Racocetra persica]